MLDAFREEVHAWLKANAPPRMATPPANTEEVCWGGKKIKYPEDVIRWRDVCAERGFTTRRWQEPLGGGGLSREEATVLQEGMTKLHLRPPLVGFGLTMIGPLILQEGSDDLKKKYIPPITRGEVRWCQ